MLNPFGDALHVFDYRRHDKLRALYWRDKSQSYDVTPSLIRNPACRSHFGDEFFREEAACTAVHFPYNCKFGFGGQSTDCLLFFEGYER